ncbi:MAG TPA: DUF5658 family protein [Planctomycetota bacterium]|nr:DUF5658 family protein [Planctomycetota bacterium]
MRQPLPSSTLLFGLPATTLAMLLLFLAGMDSVATVLFVQRDLGHELNPLMQWLFSHGIAPFVLTKLLLTALCVQWIVRRAGHPYARLAALMGLSIYVPIVGLHILNNYVTFSLR